MKAHQSIGQAVADFYPSVNVLDVVDRDEECFYMEGDFEGAQLQSFMDWLESYLDNVGLDGVLYARCLLSILRQSTDSIISDCLDFDANKRPRRSTISRFGAKKAALIDCLKSDVSDEKLLSPIVNEILDRFCSLQDTELKQPNDSIDSGVCPSPDENFQNYDEAFPPLSDNLRACEEIRQITGCQPADMNNWRPLTKSACNYREILGSSLACDVSAKGMSSSAFWTAVAAATDVDPNANSASIPRKRQRTADAVVEARSAVDMDLDAAAAGDHFPDAALGGRYYGHPYGCRKFSGHQLGLLSREPTTRATMAGSFGLVHPVWEPIGKRQGLLFGSGSSTDNTIRQFGATSCESLLELALGSAAAAGAGSGWSNSNLSSFGRPRLFSAMAFNEASFMRHGSVSAGALHRTNLTGAASFTSVYNPYSLVDGTGAFYGRSASHVAGHGCRSYSRRSGSGGSRSLKSANGSAGLFRATFLANRVVAAGASCHRSARVNPTGFRRTLSSCPIDYSNQSTSATNGGCNIWGCSGGIQHGAPFRKPCMTVLGHSPHFIVPKCLKVARLSTNGFPTAVFRPISVDKMQTDDRHPQRDGVSLSGSVHEGSACRKMDTDNFNLTGMDMDFNVADAPFWPPTNSTDWLCPLIAEQGSKFWSPRQTADLLEENRTTSFCDTRGSRQSGVSLASSGETAERFTGAGSNNHDSILPHSPGFEMFDAPRFILNIIDDDSASPVSSNKMDDDRLDAREQGQGSSDWSGVPSQPIPIKVERSVNMIIDNYIASGQGDSPDLLSGGGRSVAPNPPRQQQTLPLSVPASSSGWPGYKSKTVGSVMAAGGNAGGDSMLAVPIGDSYHPGSATSSIGLDTKIIASNDIVFEGKPKLTCPRHGSAFNLVIPGRISTRLSNHSVTELQLDEFIEIDQQSESCSSNKRLADCSLAEEVALQHVPSFSLPDSAFLYDVKDQSDYLSGSTAVIVRAGGNKNVAPVESSVTDFPFSLNRGRLDNPYDNLEPNSFCLPKFHGSGTGSNGSSMATAGACYMALTMDRGAHHGPKYHPDIVVGSAPSVAYSTSNLSAGYNWMTPSISASTKDQNSDSSAMLVDGGGSKVGLPLSTQPAVNVMYASDDFPSITPRGSSGSSGVGRVEGKISTLLDFNKSAQPEIPVSPRTHFLPIRAESMEEAFYPIPGFDDEAENIARIRELVADGYHVLVESRKRSYNRALPPLGANPSLSSSAVMTFLRDQSMPMESSQHAMPPGCSVPAKSDWGESAASCVAPADLNWSKSSTSAGNSVAGMMKRANKKLALKFRITKSDKICQTDVPLSLTDDLHMQVGQSFPDCDEANSAATEDLEFYGLWIANDGSKDIDLERLLYPGFLDDSSEEVPSALLKANSCNPSCSSEIDIGPNGLAESIGGNPGCGFDPGSSLLQPFLPGGSRLISHVRESSTDSLGLGESVQQSTPRSSEVETALNPLPMDSLYSAPAEERPTLRNIWLRQQPLSSWQQEDAVDEDLLLQYVSNISLISPLETVMGEVPVDASRLAGHVEDQASAEHYGDQLVPDVTPPEPVPPLDPDHNISQVFRNSRVKGSANEGYSQCYAGSAVFTGATTREHQSCPVPSDPFHSTRLQQQVSVFPSTRLVETVAVEDKAAVPSEPIDTGPSGYKPHAGLFRHLGISQIRNGSEFQSQPCDATFVPAPIAQPSDPAPTTALDLGEVCLQQNPSISSNLHIDKDSMTPTSRLAEKQLLMKNQCELSDDYLSIENKALQIFADFGTNVTIAHSVGIYDGENYVHSHMSTSVVPDIKSEWLDTMDIAEKPLVDLSGHWHQEGGQAPPLTAHATARTADYASQGSLSAVAPARALAHPAHNVEKAVSTAAPADSFTAQDMPFLTSSSVSLNEYCQGDRVRASRLGDITKSEPIPTVPVPIVLVEQEPSTPV